MTDLKAEITVQECTDLSWLDRRIFGWTWWWQARLPCVGIQYGFARTREGAQAKAEAAARAIATQKRAPFEQYGYEVKESNDPQ